MIMPTCDIDVSLRRVPPHDLEAERAVIGCLLLDNSALADLDPNDFYHTAHRVLFQAITSLVDQGSVADAVTLCDALRGAGNLDKVGGAVYLAEIMDSAVSAATIPHYAKIIKRKARERRIIAEATRLIDSAYDPAVDSESVLTEAQRTILSLSLSSRQDTTRSSHDIAKATFSAIERRHRDGGLITGLPTGFTRLDSLTGGLQQGNLIIIAGRPGMGKTAFAVNILAYLALEGYPVAIFSLEMPADQIMIRILSGLTGIDSRLLARGFVRDDQWPSLVAATQRISEAPLVIDDQAGITPTEIRAKARKMKAEQGIAAICVDYLQLMRVPGRHEIREQQVAEASRSLKEIARELEIPVIALSQLNRQVEQRIGDKRPGMGDLRESGAIEQDADIIAFIYRDEIYNKADDNLEKGFAEIIIGKHRNGPPGAVKLRYTAHCTRFEDL